MNKSLDLPLCIITGVGPEKGTGAEIARRFSVENYKVAMIARNKNNLDYWTSRWTSINEDEPMQNTDEYPLKYANMIIESKKERILEAGCGAGRILRYYHEKNYNIIGIDFISEAINKLKAADRSLTVFCSF